MQSEHPHVSIFLLNWNFWQHTIECMESILKSDYPNFTIILIDQNSHNDSIDKIKSWANGDYNEEIETAYKSLVFPLVKKPIHIAEMKVDSIQPDHTQIPESEYSARIILLKSPINYGFAIGNNICHDVARKMYDSKYYYILNNDTVIRSNAISELVNCMENQPEVGAAQSVIYYYSHPELIANAGGRILFWGQSKYYKKITPGSVKNISFINGCALFVSKETIERVGMLSDKFFFMEDDFNYSMRLKRQNIKKACVADSHVFHKIGLCADEMFENPEKRVMLFALNRMVDLKQFYTKINWRIWKNFALGYFYALMVLRYKVKLKTAYRTSKLINYYSNRIEDVKKDTWNEILDGVPDWSIN
jgi:GT2 family glycosyltransferase